MNNYSIGSERAKDPEIYLFNGFNGGSYSPIYKGFVISAIPLLITGSITARVRSRERVPVLIPLQEGSIVCAVGAEGVFLDQESEPSI